MSDSFEYVSVNGDAYRIREDEAEHGVWIELLRPVQSKLDLAQRTDIDVAMDAIRDATMPKDGDDTLDHFHIPGDLLEQVAGGLLKHRAIIGKGATNE